MDKKYYLDFVKYPLLENSKEDLIAYIRYLQQRIEELENGEWDD